MTMAARNEPIGHQPEPDEQTMVYPGRNRPTGRKILFPVDRRNCHTIQTTCIRSAIEINFYLTLFKTIFLIFCGYSFLVSFVGLFFPGEYP
jgi:hypothetical protein